MDPITLYVVGCFMAGFLGRDTRLGFLGMFCASVFLTPVTTLLALFFFGGPEERPRPKMPEPAAQQPDVVATATVESIENPQTPADGAPVQEPSASEVRNPS